MTRAGSTLRAAFASVLVMLAACATGAAPTDIEFAPGSHRALVVIGVEGFDRWQGVSATLHFRGVDAAGAPDGRGFTVSNGNGWREMHPAEYFVVDVEPGRYVATNLMTVVHPTTTLVTFCPGTVRFDVPAGQAVYVGNLYVPRSGPTVEQRPSHFEAAAAKLAEYPGVSQRLTAGTMEGALSPARCGQAEATRND
jgi:hypothetical protein